MEQQTSTAARTPCVLFVARAETRPRAALLRAAAIAASQAASLHLVLAVGVPAKTSRMLFPQRAMDALRGRVRDEHRLALAREWAARLVPSARIEVAQGDVSTVARAAAERLGAGMLVLAAHDLAIRRDAVWLATELRIPVLVARRAAGRTTVLAATDLRNADLPVVGTAAALAARNHGRVVAIHNVPSAVVVPMSPYGTARTIGASPADLRTAGERLRVAAGKRHGVTETILAAEADTSAAVVQAAAAVAADVVAVGARRRSWIDRLLFGSVAEGVVERCGSSVLLMPLDAAAAS